MLFAWRHPEKCTRARRTSLRCSQVSTTRDSSWPTYLDDNAVEYDAGLTDNQLKKIALKHKQKQALLGAAGESCLKDPIGDPSKRDLSVKNLKRGVAQSNSPKDNFSVKAYVQSMPPVTCRLKHSLDPGEGTCRGTVANGKCLQCGADGVTGVYGYSTEVVISDDPFDDKNAMVLKVCDAGGFALFGCKAPEFMQFHGAGPRCPRGQADRCVAGVLQVHRHGPERGQAICNCSLHWSASHRAHDAGEDVGQQGWVVGRAGHRATRAQASL